ncbi:MAG: lytic transglycosylase domain-containing protein [Syntrophales bacterium]|jgi:soluble lytic murein transglycosylase-like protein|nr:lytic transglycosylase domain-containing protein [Syntrophales bacterium]MCK9528356.1 lytic transglycosylase domain-containing protein [Syntrophales bacterium]MDX9922719.1 lytic transglycosylase domain-containing protein [Syntrophales bacterium]
MEERTNSTLQWIPGKWTAVGLPILALVCSISVLALDGREACTGEYRPQEHLFARFAEVQSLAEPETVCVDPVEEEAVIIVWRDDSFDDIIEERAQRYGIEPELVKAIIMAESGYDPMAVSSGGARGLMQLMPRTAESLGVEDCFDPVENIDAGIRHFRDLMDQFDEQTTLALAAYNAGSRRVREYQGVPPYPATKIYIKNVFRYYRYFKNITDDTAEHTA